jgi:ankyrin repeat protein
MKKLLVLLALCVSGSVDFVDDAAAAPMKRTRVKAGTLKGNDGTPVKASMDDKSAAKKRQLDCESENEASVTKQVVSIDEMFKKAAVDCNVALMQQLISDGADVNAPDAEGLTALMHVILSKNPNAEQAVDVLLAAPGINVNATNAKGLTALMYSISEINFDIMTKLLAVPGIDVNARSRFGHSALSLVVRRDLHWYGEARFVNALLRAGALQYAGNGYGYVMDTVHNTSLLTHALLFAHKAYRKATGQPN